MEKQDLDHFSSPILLTVSSLERLPQFVIDGRPFVEFSGLFQRRGPGERTRLESEKLKIVIEMQALFPNSIQAIVPSDNLALMDDHNRLRSDSDLDSATVTDHDRDRVVVAGNRDSGLGIDSRTGDHLRRKVFPRSGSQARNLRIPIGKN